MKIIPSTIYTDNGYSRQLINRGERKVFRVLEAVDFGNLHDVALHSFNITKADWQRWCETDFIIITKFGLLLLEVKGGNVKCQDGIWKYSGKTTRNSPGTQAKEAFYHLDENYLKASAGLKRITQNVPMGFGCVFPEISRIVSHDESPLPEQDDAITCYKDEALDEKQFKGFIIRLYDHYKSTLLAQDREVSEFGREDIQKLSNMLRPSFAKEVSLNTSLSENRRIMHSLTEEQYEKIDFIQSAPRAMIKGGAGTGKTTLALSASRQEASLGKKTIFLSRSPIFTGFIKNNNKRENFTVCSLGELDLLIQKGMVFDTLIMDEGQDLCNFQSIDKIEKIVAGGLDDGRWRWFGDPNNQVSPSIEFDETAYEYLESVSSIKTKLKYNIRNTPTIIADIENLTQADLGSCKEYTGKSDPAEIGCSKSIPETYSDAQDKLKEWIRNEVRPSEIAILVPDEGIIEKIRPICINLNLDFRVLNQNSYNFGQAGSIVISTFDDFKGLERQCILILGIDDILIQGKADDNLKLKKIFYSSMTRANYKIYISATKVLKTRMAEIYEEHLELNH